MSRTPGVHVDVWWGVVVEVDLYDQPVEAPDSGHWGSLTVVGSGSALMGRSGGIRSDLIEQPNLPRAWDGTSPHDALKTRAAGAALHPPPPGGLPPWAGGGREPP